MRGVDHFCEMSWNMMAQSRGPAQPNLVQVLDTAPLNMRYWRAIGMITTAAMLDYFDFVIVGFIIAVIGPAWKLTFVETSVILISAGIGSVVGSLVWGVLSDLIGRKFMLVCGIAICGSASGAIAFVPDGAWVPLTALRFLVGLGMAGAGIGSITLAVELTPVRVRTVLASSVAIPGSLGVFAAALLSSALLPSIGWRGLALVGFAPLVLVVPVLIWVPESARWLMSRSRAEDARKAASSLLDLPVEHVAQPPAIARQSGGARLSEVYSEPQVFWFVALAWLGFSVASYGVLLWGPTILSLILGVDASRAAQLYIAVSLAGLAGRIFFAVLPQWLGRRLAGQITGLGIALALGAVSLFFQESIGGFPLIVVLLCIGALFFDGGASNLGPLSAEVFPAHLAARGSGVGQAANGIGKILGPLVLAFIAGTDNLLTPQATIDAAGPAFAFLAGCGLLVWFAFAFLGVETHLKTLKLGDSVEDRLEVAGSAPSPDLLQGSADTGGPRAHAYTLGELGGATAPTAR
ncbi:MFS transporter [Novosphingobium sp. Gsoil 351]|uniref:MFS transporter n=1 Tax=Novosphingobium sp. Gsoil 351 TaxID=2675225 RepID=UPI0012B4712D|nr:MFS transporter [Novosphingobium sp. Gsoil 351]QGN55028.1 MFS transporter [Novosphingobium sp. Gsoil 351]